MSVHEVRFYHQDRKDGFLSNFYPADFWLVPHWATERPLLWQTSEHYYQAEKASTAEDGEAIRLAASPAEAKRLAHKVDLDPNEWHALGDTVMLRSLCAKFAQNDPLRRMLMNAGGDRFVEASPRDAYWGEGRDGQGENRLGQLLGVVRAGVSLVGAEIFVPGGVTEREVFVGTPTAKLFDVCFRLWYWAADLSAVKGL